MREIVIDTETSGFDLLGGHRARLDLKSYLRRRLDAFINPGIHVLGQSNAEHHGHVGGAGGLKVTAAGHRLVRLRPYEIDDEPH